MNEREVSKAADATAIADEYVLTRKDVFVTRENPKP